MRETPYDPFASMGLIMKTKNAFGLLLLLLFASTANSSDIWVSHVSRDHGWRTSLSIFYGGSRESATIAILRFKNNGARQGSQAVLHARRNAWTPVADRLLAYIGSARAQSDEEFVLKASYRHEASGNVVEQLLGEDARQQWVLPNRVLPEFERSGIALVNSSDARATVTMVAWRAGQVLSERSVSLTPYSRYAEQTERIWSGISYRDIDRITVRSSVQIAPPVWIIESVTPPRRLMPAARPVRQADLCILNGTLIDGAGGPVVPDAVVLVRSGIITAAGRRADVRIPPGIRRLDARGGYILPGFINAHVHNAVNEPNLDHWASEGVTTVRDVGARTTDSAVRFRDSMLFNRSSARLVEAGLMVTVPNGYPIMPNGFPALTVTSPEDARAIVGGQIDQGVDLIKITLEPGSGPMLTQDEVEAIVQTAHSRRIPVTAHVDNADTLRLAVDSGVDYIEHVPWDRVEDSLIRRMVQAGTIIVPTLAAYRNHPGVVDNLQRFYRAGGTIAMGNDGGYVTGLEIGMPISELLAMENAGLSRMQVIVSATRNAALICRLDRMLGTVEPGKEADLLVVRHDPLSDLRNLSDIGWVIHAGVVISPQ